MSELIREALDEHLPRNADERRQEVLRTAAGLWAERSDLSQLDAARATLDRGLSFHGIRSPYVRPGQRADR